MIRVTVLDAKLLTQTDSPVDASAGRERLGRGANRIGGSSSRPERVSIA
jgi:hypothetical protein